MRTPEQIATRMAGKYWSTWRSALIHGAAGPFSFALEPPSRAEITQASSEVAAWLALWGQWAAAHPQIDLRSRTVRTSRGAQPLFTHVDAANLDALASITTETAQHWSRAVHRWRQLQRIGSGAPVQRWLKQIMDLADADLTILIAATTWFQAHPRSGLTVRRVPVAGMSTKWLTRNRRLVLACLDTTAGPPAGDDVGSDEIDPVDIPIADLDRLGLRPLPREVDVLLCDPTLRKLVGGVRQLRSPINELAVIPFNPSHLLIVENKESALALHDVPGLIVVHSLGNHLDVLQHLPWVTTAKLWYWGDLDRHGLTLLSRARAQLPDLTSLFMTDRHLQRYQWLSIEESEGRWDAPEPNLIEGERAALEMLLAGDRYRRLEQERLPVEDVEVELDHQLTAVAIST